MAAGRRAGGGGSTRIWGETLYFQPLSVSAPYTPWDDKLVGLAFHFAEVWAGGHQRCFCAWTPPPHHPACWEALPSRRRAGGWGQGSANLALTELACPHCACSPGAPPSPGAGLCPRGALAAGFARKPACHRQSPGGMGSRGVHAGPACLLGFSIWAGWAAGLFLGGPSPPS